MKSTPDLQTTGERLAAMGREERSSISLVEHGRLVVDQESKAMIDVRQLLVSGENPLRNRESSLRLISLTFLILILNLGAEVPLAFTSSGRTTYSSKKMTTIRNLLTQPFDTSRDIHPLLPRMLGSQMAVL